MQGLNKTTLFGTIAKDPDINKGAVRLTIPTCEKWTDKNGEKQEKTEWHRVVLFNKNAEIAEKYLQKGSNVYIEGRNETTKYTDRDGVEKYSTQVVANLIRLLPGGPQNKTQDSQQEPTGTAEDIPF